MTTRWSGLRLTAPVCVLSAVMACIAAAQTYRNLSSVHDGSGIMSTNTVALPDGRSYTNVSAAGQPGGVAISSNATYVNYAGFLQAVDIKRPLLDTDGDGTIDEIDADNDGDALPDATEVAGTGFDPQTATLVNQADTDGDGVPDGSEARAQTDPTDSNAFLRILSIADAGGGREITYFARSGTNYTVRNADGTFAYPTNALGTDPAETPGFGAWQVRTNTYVDSSAATNARFYAIEP